MNYFVLCSPQEADQAPLQGLADALQDLFGTIDIAAKKADESLTQLDESGIKAWTDITKGASYLLKGLVGHDETNDSGVRLPSDPTIVPDSTGCDQQEIDYIHREYSQPYCSPFQVQNVEDCPTPDGCNDFDPQHASCNSQLGCGYSDPANPQRCNIGSGSCN
jgi:hypothetical protein